MLPFHFISIILVATSTVIIISSSSFISVWIAFEVNTLAFIPLIKGKGAAKYFLAQRLGSAIILSSLALNARFIAFVGAALKAGIAPLHIWFPQVIINLPWLICILLATWQKIGPLCIIHTVLNSVAASFLVFIRSFLGVIGALTQTKLRRIIAYSSIVNMAWIVAGIQLGLFYRGLYLVIYSFTTIIMLVLIARSNPKTISMRRPLIVLTLASVAGLPPFIGLVPKIIILISSSIILFMPLIISSIIIIYVYTRIIFRRKLGTLNRSPAIATFFTLITPLIIICLFSISQYKCLPSIKCP